MNNRFWIRFACVAVALLMAIVVIAGAQFIGSINKLSPLAHKLEHFVYYAGMAVLLAHALGRPRLWIAFLVVAAIGAVDEWHQAVVPGRHSSVIDWMIDMTGVGLALFLYAFWPRRAPVAMPGSAVDAARDAAK